MRELEDVRRMMGILHDVAPKMKRVYVLAGNEPVESCYERALKVIEWGGEPFCQYVRPLNWLGRSRNAEPPSRLDRAEGHGLLPLLQPPSLQVHADRGIQTSRRRTAAVRGRHERRLE
jgi:hypothetical protein